LTQHPDHLPWSNQSKPGAREQFDPQPTGGPEKGGDFMTFRSTLIRFFSFIRRDERGQGLAEYALILGLIAIVAIVALLFMGGQVSDKLSTIGSQLQSVAG
jgi:pilus assembly protein Flp/PilA